MLGKQSEVDKMLNAMKGQGVIIESDSSWLLTVVLLSHMNGDL